MLYKYHFEKVITSLKRGHMMQLQVFLFFFVVIKTDFN